MNKEFLNTESNLSCSVLLPIYNGANFIDNSINSILSTMRNQDELLIINDGSEDISASNLRNYENLDSRIRIFNKRHSGLVETLNFGVDACANEFIARADVDDEYHINRIQKQINYLSENPKCAAVFSDYKILSLNNEDLGTIPTAIYPDFTKLSLLNPQRTAHPSVMFRKSAIKSAGLYMKEDFPAEDLSLWIRLSREFEIATIPETLLYYKLHKSNITNMYQNPMEAKTKDLVNQLMEDIDIYEILSRSFSLFNDYKFSEYGDARRLLLCRDLLKFLKLSDRQGVLGKSVNLIKFYQILSPKTFKIAFQLWRDQQLRIRQRSA